MSWVDEFKKHWLIIGIGIIAICCGATWKICLETRVYVFRSNRPLIPA